MEIRNAAPIHYMDGLKDESAVRVFPEPKGLTQFQPLIISHAEKGPYGEFEVTGAELETIFGLDTINPLSKFSTHQSIYAAKLLEAGGQISFMRLPYSNDPGQFPYIVGDPADTNGIANITYYLTITDPIVRKPFLRNADGLVEIVNGVPVEDSTAADINVRYAMITAKYTPGFTENTVLGKVQVANGATIDGVSVNITAYPLYTIPAEAHGEYYNNIGHSLTVGDDPDMVAKGMKPFVFSLYDRSTGYVKQHTTNDEAKGIVFTFRPDSSHPMTNKSITFEDLIPHDFGNYTNKDYPIKPYTIGKVKLYRQYIDEIVAMITTGEIVGYNGTVPSYSDYTIVSTTELYSEMYLANFVDFTHTNGAWYEYTRYMENGLLTPEAQIAVGNKVVNSTSTPTYLQGGYDGNVLDKTVFESGVTNLLKAEFGNPSSRLNDMAISRFSTFIDSGFSQEFKLDFGIILKQRKDLNLIGATYAINTENKRQEIDEAISVAAILNTMYSIYTESAEYETPTFRYCIVMGSGLARFENYRYHMPLTYDFAYKNIRMFGTKNGIWNTVYEFSSRGGNEVTEQIDIYPDFVPDTIKSKLWLSNLIWAQNKDKQTQIYPGLQTGYNDDTSVINGWYSVIADCYAQKVLNETYMYLVGDQTMTKSEFKDEFEKYANNMLAGKFGNIIIAKPVLYYTKADDARGYSANAYIELYIPNMKTVLRSHTVAKRIDNLQ